MSSEAAIERHIEAGGSGASTNHDAAPEEYVSYQDLAVEIDLDEATDEATDEGNLPRTAPAGFSIALPSAASRDVPVSIGPSGADPDGPMTDDDGFDFFVGGAAPAAHALTEPLHAPAEPALAGPETVPEANLLPDPEPTADDTAQLPQGEILAFEDAGSTPDLEPDPQASSPLPVMDPAPDLPEEGALHLPDRLRNPLPPPEDAELAAAAQAVPSADQPTAIDLTDAPAGVDVTDLIEAESEDDLHIVDAIPDVSEQVRIDPDLAVLDGSDLADEHRSDPGQSEERGTGEGGVAQPAQVRLFTRKDAGGIPSSGAVLDEDRSVIADLDPTAHSVLGEQDHAAPEPTALRTAESVDEGVEYDVEESAVAEPVAPGRGAGWSTNAPEESGEWDQTLEPRRTWLDRVAAVIFVLCLVGAAVFIALNI